MIKKRIGIIGLDTSHVKHLVNALKDNEELQITNVFPHSQQDFEFAYRKITENVRYVKESGAVQMCSSIQQVVNSSDVIWIESADARLRLEQCQQVIPSKKPVYLNKPLALSYQEALEIKDLVYDYQTPFMCGSALRWTEAVKVARNMDVQSLECFGPIEFQPTQPGYYWYGIHCLEMLQAIVDTKLNVIDRLIESTKDTVILQDIHQRVHQLTLNKGNAYDFGIKVMGEDQMELLQVDKLYDGWIRELLQFSLTGIAPITLDDNLEVIKLIEAIHQTSRE